MRRFLHGFLSWMVLSIGLLTRSAPAFGAADFCQVEARRKPGDPWKTYPTRTLENLPGFSLDKTDPELTQFGGLREGKAEATGFFRTQKIGGRWWLIDPEGGRFINVGVAGVRPGRTGISKAALADRFGSEDEWATACIGLLRTNGFNGTGGWSEAKSLSRASSKIVYALNLSFMATFASRKGRTHPEPGHTGYADGCILVFDPDFETFSCEYARRLNATKDDPWLLGYFSDNEMPLDDGVLARFLQLPPESPGCKAATEWLKGQRKGSSLELAATPLTAGEREAFLQLVVARYFRIVSAAIRKHDPNHLYLGARLNGPAIRLPAVFRGAGPFVDVHSINYYNTWTPRSDRLALWVNESGKPCLVSEFYVKGLDSGLGNQSGAGWEVKTQADRGRFYQNYVLGLLESQTCVGWHWFRYMDNDPTEKSRDASNEDSNKGIVTSRYEPHRDLLSGMRRLNTRVYDLVEYFDMHMTEKENGD